MKKILVTGSEGFIGSHLTEKLLSLGFHVKAFVLYNSFGKFGWLDTINIEKYSNLEVILGDIRDYNFVVSSMKNCDAVLHLAALIGIPYSYHSPESYVDTNIKGTLNILQASRQTEVEKVIHTSTSEVYGSAQYVPIDEGHPLVGQSPYSASKIAADQLALSFHRSFGLPVTILRPFNTYGPRQSARAVIPNIISQIATGKDTINLGSLDPTRDFSYVSDTVDGFIACLNAKKVSGEVYNLGSNFEVSIGKTLEMISDLMLKNVNVNFDEKRVRPKNSEVDRLYSENKRAIKYLNWKPKFSGIKGFRMGLEETIKWFTNKENLKFYNTNIYNL